METNYLQKGVCLKYRPTERVEPGTIVKIGSLIGVVGHAIEPNCLGAVDVVGFYEIPKESGTKFAVGAPVYVADGVAATSGGDLFGFAVEDADETAAVVPTMLVPYASALNVTA